LTFLCHGGVPSRVFEASELDPSLEYFMVEKLRTIVYGSGRYFGLREVTSLERFGIFTAASTFKNIVLLHSAQALIHISLRVPGAQERLRIK
jgi:hypothetical protein